MKNSIINIKLIFLSFLLLFNASCDEQELNEVPKDFFSAENAYKSMTNYQSALTDLYARVRDIHFGNESQDRFVHFLATDIAKHARGDANRFGDYNVHVVPTSGTIRNHWVDWYKVISNANTIISRLPESELTDEQKKLVQAEAKFFRAFAYRYLVYLFGGVPLILDEVTEPKTDFTRATKEEVLNQIVADAKEAAESLPNIDQVADGKVSNLVAKQLLAETYISLQDYDKAITAATEVIEDPNTQLMTTRFGAKATQTPGDVYRDLFTKGNQNRSSGNKEALWVAQMEVDVIGGLLTSSGSPFVNALERWAAPVAFLTFKDPDGKEGATGQGESSLNVGGRGVSFMMNTDYFLYDIWQSDWENDIRNAPHNIVRDFKYNNPSSKWYDSSSVKYPSPTWKSQKWRWYPYPAKVTTPGDHPDDLFSNKEKGFLKTTAGATYRDMYLMRLAETYLLRAEAYLNKGDLVNAAADINMVRARANATPVDPADVDLDYILDERAREMVYEEQRRITLQRTGTLVDRVRRYNDLNSDDIQDHNALWPIPFAEIEANKNAVLEQNPGYDE